MENQYSHWMSSTVKKCRALVTILKHRTIGPFFFEDDLANTVIAAKESYTPLLELFLVEIKKHNNLDEEEQWLQQDGSLPHTANVTIALLREKFGKHLICQKA